MNRKTSVVVKIGLLSAIAFVLMYLEFPVPFFPPWLKFDFSDVPALLGAFAVGPVAGVVIELVKNLLFIALRGSQTGGVGEFANFILGAAFVLPAGWIYMKNKTRNGSLWGLIAGIIGLIVFGCIANYFVLIPFYARIMPIEQLFKGASAASNGIIHDMKTYIFYGVAPYNLLKGAAESIVTFLLYKRLSKILHR